MLAWLTLSTLKMAAVSSSEMFMSFYRAIERHIAEDCLFVRYLTTLSGRGYILLTQKIISKHSLIRSNWVGGRSPGLVHQQVAIKDKKQN
jgi:hypothetical protein